MMQEAAIGSSRWREKMPKVLPEKPCASLCGDGDYSWARCPTWVKGMLDNACLALKSPALQNCSARTNCCNIESHNCKRCFEVHLVESSRIPSSVADAGLEGQKKTLNSGKRSNEVALTNFLEFVRFEEDLRIGSAVLGGDSRAPQVRLSPVSQTPSKGQLAGQSPNLKREASKGSVYTSEDNVLTWALRSWYTIVSRIIYCCEIQNQRDVWAKMAALIDRRVDGAARHIYFERTSSNDGLHFVEDGNAADAIVPRQYPISPTNLVFRDDSPDKNGWPSARERAQYLQRLYLERERSTVPLPPLEIRAVLRHVASSTTPAEGDWKASSTTPAEVAAKRCSSSTPKRRFSSRF